MNKRIRMFHAAAAALAFGFWLAAPPQADASDAARQQHAMLAGGGDFSVMTDQNGSVWAWGSNAYGQLGTGDDTAHPSPNRVTAADGRTLGNAVAVAAGTRHALAVRADGTVWTWGDRLGGSHANAVSFGDGSPLSEVIAASAGGSHDLALLADGTVWGWGDNRGGQLGDGTTMNRSAPVQVVKQDGAALTNVSAVAAGADYSLALRSDGSVWTWGRADDGREGGTRVQARVSPEPVMQKTGAAFDGAIQLAAGVHAAYALKSDGTVWTWKAGERGAEPQPMRGTDDAKLTGIRSISAEADSDRLLALGSDGLVHEWKDGSVSTVLVRGPSHHFKDIRTIAAGREHGIALAADGTLWAWGSNTGGQLGNGDHGGDSGGYAIPITTYEQTRFTTSSIGSAGSSSMELARDGTLWAYGSNSSGQLGIDMSTPSLSVPRQVVLKGNEGELSSIVQWSMGSSHAAAVDASGQVWAWGSNRSGELGAATEPGPDRSDVAVRAAAPIAVKNVAVGTGHTAALTRDGRVLVWGDNKYGQVGDGSLPLQSGPAFVLTSNKEMLSGVVAVSCGDSYTLALTADGRVWSWGRNNYGQLGNGADEGERSVAAPVLTLDSDLEAPLSGIVAVAAGPEHALALAADGRIYAWGSNSNGQLGLGDGKSRSYAIPLSALKRFTAVSAASRVSAGMDTDGNVWTWGSNANGAIGSGKGPDSSSILEPVRITNNGGYKAVSLGDDHGMALTADSVLYVWGKNDYGQLGRENPALAQSPLLRQAIEPLSASSIHSELSVQADAPAADGYIALKVRVYVKDDADLPIWGQKLTAKVSTGVIEPLQLIYAGGYEAIWKLPFYSSSATVQVFLRKEMIAEKTYPAQ